MTDGRIADGARKAGQSRNCAPDIRRVFDLEMAHAGADHDGAVLGRDKRKLLYTRQIDQMRRIGKTLFHDGNQRLAAREKPCVMQTRKQRLRLRD